MRWNLLGDKEDDLPELRFYQQMRGEFHWREVITSLQDCMKRIRGLAVRSFMKSCANKYICEYLPTGGIGIYSLLILLIRVRKFFGMPC